MPDQISTLLIALLKRERRAIRTADFEGLAALAEDKAQLFNALPKSSATQRDLARIKQQIDENQTLLGAAISGVAAAQDRLAAVRHVRDGLTIYDQSGQMAKVPAARPGLEKKA